MNLLYNLHCHYKCHFEEKIKTESLFIYRQIERQVNLIWFLFFIFLIDYNRINFNHYRFLSVVAESPASLSFWFLRILFLLTTRFVRFRLDNQLIHFCYCSSLPWEEYGVFFLMFDVLWCQNLKEERCECTFLFSHLLWLRFFSSVT